MLELDRPLLLLLLLLPVLLRRWIPAYAERRQAIRAPFFRRIARLAGREPSEGAVVARGPLVQRALVWVAWGLLVLAVAGPRWIEEPLVETRAARDLLLVVDLSQSMDTNDFTDASGARVDRLTAVKQVLDTFITQRKDDRIGLILFGNAAFVQAPFTEDHQVLRTLLDESETGMCGPQTMMGEAIGLGIKVFEEREAEQRVMILLTDGNDSGSKIPPVKAAEIAAERGITIHPIGVGDPEVAGEQPLDEETLEAIAKATGGTYFRAMDRDQLAGVYDELDALMPKEVDSISYRPTLALSWIPALAMVILTLLYHGGQFVRSVRR